MRIVKTDFLISPAYPVLPMMQSRCAKFRTMKVSEGVWSIGGNALKPGAQMTVNSGTWRRYSSLRLRLEEHVPREERVPGLLGDDPDRQPVVGVGAAEAVLHEEVAPLEVALQPAEELVELLGAKGRLYAPHQMFPSESGSRTTNLSFAARAVCLPVSTTIGPACAIRASPAEDDLLVERLGREVPVDLPEVREAVVGEAVVGLQRLRPAPSAGVLMSRRLFTASPSRASGRRS